MPVKPTPALSPTGAALLELAGRHLGEKYVLGAPVPKDNPGWRGPWDCAEFASWLVFQVGGRLYGCNNDASSPSVADAYTGYWQRDANALGQVMSVEEAAAIPGACVLRVPGAGALGHIVISDGEGGTVEAHSTKMGVIRSTLAQRRWDKGILVPGIDYTAGPGVSVPAPAIVYRLTQPLMTGPKVVEIQQALENAGFNPGVIDGQFGPHTQAAVIAFQLSLGLVSDGEVGAATAGPLGLEL